MKELSIEEKAKRYDGAIDKAKKELDACGSQDCDAARQIFRLFPELIEESEDEKVRKEITQLIQGMHDADPRKERWLAWLEKQGQTFTKEDTDNANKVEPKDYNGIDPHVGIPIDKIGPKFKVGDWITNGAEKPSQISSIEDDMYYTHNGTIGGDIESMDKEYHLWTIQDVKEGDVLVNDHHILILKELDYDRNGTPSSVKAYCDIDPNGNFEIGKDGWGFCVTLHIHPATNEQWDTLFTKMKEAGFEWDAEKKELKKISQRIISAEAKEAMYGKPAAWSDEDENILEAITYTVKNSGYSHCIGVSIKVMIAWLKSLKQRIKL